MATAEQGKGVFINGAMVKRNGQIFLDMEIGNKTATPVSQLAIQFNKNTFGLTPGNVQINLPQPVSNGSSVSVSVGVSCTPPMLNAAEVNLNLQTAIKNAASGDVFYFVIPVALEAVFAPNATLDVESFANSWKGIADTLEVNQLVNLPVCDPEAIKSKLAAKDIAWIAHRDLPGNDGQSSVFYFCRTFTNVLFYIEFKFKRGVNVTKVSVKSQNKAMSELCKQYLAKLIA